MNEWSTCMAIESIPGKVERGVDFPRAQGSRFPPSSGDLMGRCHCGRIYRVVSRISMPPTK